MNFWRQACSDDLNRVSSSRIAVLIAAGTLSISTLMLTAGSFWHLEMLPTLGVFGSFLAAMAGAGYGVNKWAAKAKTNEPVS